jgi:hypothetical protein
MGRRNRARNRAGEREAFPDAPEASYTSADGDQVLVLRSVMTAKTRTQYAAARAGSPLSQEDAWHRAVEFLFERLAVRWDIHEVPLTTQKEILARFRMGSQDERAWIREVMRTHCAEFFPDVEAP